MPVSFVIENLSCEFALVDRSSKISENYFQALCQYMFWSFCAVYTSDLAGLGSHCATN